MVKGYKQTASVDFSEVISLVVKVSTIHTILSIVASENLHLEQMDMKTLFLHDDLEEDMHQPQGYDMDDKEHSLCKLKKILYELKQAPRHRYKCFNFMKEIGFKRCYSDF